VMIFLRNVILLYLFSEHDPRVEPGRAFGKPVPILFRIML
jgi:hypothetical protein